MGLYIYDQPIKANQMAKFHETLCSTGGRYLRNPMHEDGSDIIRVSYEPGDYVEQCRLWKLYTTEIKESTRKSFLQRLLFWR
jgi:hypothetical protein